MDLLAVQPKPGFLIDMLLKILSHAISVKTVLKAALILSSLCPAFTHVCEFTGGYEPRFGDAVGYSAMGQESVV